MIWFLNFAFQIIKISLKLWNRFWKNALGKEPVWNNEWNPWKNKRIGINNSWIYKFEKIFILWNNNLN